MKRFGILCLMLVLALSLGAQQRTGDIRGRVVDNEGSPLPGVTVTLTGRATAPLTAVTGEEGQFRFLSLPPAKDYILKAELPSFKARVEEGVIVTLGGTTQLTLAMEMGEISEEITVVAQTPVVDSKKTTIGNNLDRLTLQSLPTSRDPWAVFQMAPSVMIDRENVAGMESGQQASAVGKGGATVFEGQGNNAWSMDGVVITDPASLGSPGYYDFDVFEEVSVSVGGTDVSSQTGGVNINMVTRRGGNKVSLGARFFDTDSKFQADNMSDALREQGLSGVNRVNTIKDYGFNLGVPLIKDKAWFWGSYGIQDIKTILVNGSNDDTLLVNYAAKLNLQIIPQNRFEFFVHAGKKEKWGRNASVTFPRGYHQMGRYHFGTPIVKFQDEHMFGDDFLLSAQYSWTNPGFRMIPMVDEGLSHMRQLNVTTGVNENSFNYNIFDRPTKNANVRGTYFNDGLFGMSHEVKFGGEYAERNQTWINGQGPGNILMRYNYHTRTVDVTGDGLPDVARDYGVRIANINVARGANNPYNLTAYGAFLSDTMTFGRFNLILGVRYDKQVPFYKPFTIPSVQRDNAVWQNYFGPGVADAVFNVLPGLDIPENKPDFAYNTVSPRFGLTWDVTGDGKNIAKLSLAKYGDYMGVGFAGNFYPLGTGGFNNYWWIDGNGNGLIDMAELYWHNSRNYQTYRVFNDAGAFIGDWTDGFRAGRWGGYDPANPLQTTASTITIADGLNSTDTYEALFTFEREVMADFALSVNATYRRYTNFDVFWPYDPATSKPWTVDDYVQVGTIPAEMGGISTGEAAGKPYYMLKDGVELSNYTLLTKQGTSRYDQYLGFDLVFNKRFSRDWMLNGSLTYQFQTAYHDRADFACPLNFDPINANNVPNPTNLWAVNGKTYAALVGGRSGKINNYVFSPWLVKLAGMYRFPFEIDLSFTFTAQQGNIVPYYADIVDYSAPNPADQTVRVYLGEFGKNHLPTYWNLNLRLDKALRLGDAGRVHLMADLFNLFNNNKTIRQYDHYLGTWYAHDGSFSPDAQDNLIYEIVAPRVVRLGIRFEF
jgi:hypothetical protein